MSQQQSIGLSGYCPVCVIENQQWVKGDSRFAVVQDGTTYYFATAGQKQMFLSNPNKYTPALGGKCVVCFVENGQYVDGTVQFSSLHDGRLFLFPSEEIQQMFTKDPKKYADADLAAKGLCVVCKVELKKDVLGNPEHTVVHKNRRYWFPSDEQLKMFVANPARYEMN